MAILLKTSDQKLVRIDPENDVYLYKAPVNPPNTGTRYTRGADLYAHKTGKGDWYYYLLTWSMWQGEESGTELLGRKEAIAFLQDKAGETGEAALSGEEIADAVEHFGWDIFQETA